MLTLVNPASLSADCYRSRLGLVQSLFLVSVVLAPLELRLVASFTVYDLLIIVIALLVISSGPRALKFPPVEFLAALYIFLLFALLSVFRAPYPWEALTQTLQFFFIFFIQLPVILTVVKSPSVLRWSLLLLLVGTLIVTIWAMIYQQEGYHHRLRSFSSDNSNRLGYPSAYMLPFLLCLLFDNWRKRRLFSILFFLLALYSFMWALTTSGSRSATVGTMVALMTFLTFRHGLYINIKFLLRAFFILIMTGTCSYLLYQSNYFPGILRERIARTLMFDDSLIGDRTRLAIAGWRAFIDSPFVGVGLDNFRYVATRYNVPSVSEQVPHNLWIQFLAQIGLIGTLAFAALIGFWLLRIFLNQRVTYSQSQRDILWAFIASMAGIMTILMFIPLMIHRHYWLIYGLGLAAAFSSGEILIPKVSAQSKISPKLRVSV